MQVDNEFLITQFSCVEYLNNFAQTGYFDKSSFLDLIYPLVDAKPINNNQFFEIGRADVDGIVFGYRANQQGIWAFYPISHHYKFMTASLNDFIQQWQNGILTV